MHAGAAKELGTVSGGEVAHLARKREKGAAAAERLRRVATAAWRRKSKGEKRGKIEGLEG